MHGRVLEGSGRLHRLRRAKALQYGELLGRVVDQTERRVLRGEKVASPFESHTDIIVKGGRQVQYGHKVNLSTGTSGLVLDAVVERGNPADSSRCLAMIERHAEIYGTVPKQVACDAGYASKRNLHEAKALGVTDMVFERKRGLRVADMASTPGVYDKLRRFRAGIEAGISYLKRCFGLRQCHWQGLDHFRAYVWSAIVAHNLAVLGPQPVETEADVKRRGDLDGSSSRPTQASRRRLPAPMGRQSPANNAQHVTSTPQIRPDPALKA